MWNECSSSYCFPITILKARWHHQPRTSTAVYTYILPISFACWLHPILSHPNVAKGGWQSASHTWCQPFQAHRGAALPPTARSRRSPRIALAAPGWFRSPGSGQAPTLSSLKLTDRPRIQWEYHGRTITEWVLCQSWLPKSLNTFSCWWFKSEENARALGWRSHVSGSSLVDKRSFVKPAAATWVHHCSINKQKYIYIYITSN